MTKLIEFAIEAGFYVNDGEIFSPYTKEKITGNIQDLLIKIQSEIVSNISEEREPTTINYSPNERYTYNVNSTFRMICK